MSQNEPDSEVDMRERCEECAAPLQKYESTMCEPCERTHEDARASNWRGNDGGGEPVEV